MFFYTCLIVSILFLDFTNGYSITTNCSTGYQGAFCDECGIVNATNNLKIVGGITSVPHSWPSMVYIIWNYKGTFNLPSGASVTYTFKSTCGGTLIDRQTVLTAAHCIPTQVDFSNGGTSYTGNVHTNSFYPTFGSMYTVYLGLHDKSTIDFYGTFQPPTIKMSVSKVVVHEKFILNTYENDIALLYLSSNVTLNNYIQIACLPTAVSDAYPGINVNVYATGWGTTRSGGFTSNNLMNVKLTAYDSSKCDNVAPLTPSQICAGNITGGQDTCSGDSGGPLYYLDTINSTPKYVVSGITSFGIGCALPDLPGVYTRVSSFLNWINTDNPQITSPPTKTTVKQSTTTAAPATTTLNPIIDSTTQAPSSFVERSWQFLLNFRIIKRTSFNGMPPRY